MFVCGVVSLSCLLSLPECFRREGAVEADVGSFVLRRSCSRPHSSEHAHEPPPRCTVAMSIANTSDPFGASSKPKVFDPDAPIARTAAASQFMSEYPPGSEPPTETTNGASEHAAATTNAPPPRVNAAARAKAALAASQAKAGFSTLAAAATSASEKSPPKPAAPRTKFVRPSKVAASADGADDIVIAVAKPRESVPAAAAAPAAAVPRPATSPKAASASSSTAPPASTASSDENPFGTKSKAVFDPDAPIAKTSAANQFMSEYPPGMENGTEEEQPVAAPKPKPVRKPLAKKPAAATPAAAASASASSIPDDVAASAAEDVPPPSSHKLSDSPPLKATPTSSSSLSASPMLDEFPPGEDGGGADEVFTGPLEARMVHKNWKARQQAYEEMKTVLIMLSEDDDESRKREVNRFEPFLKKMVNDVSVPALEAGLQAAAAWVDKASYDMGAAAHADELMSACLKKGYSGRPGTKQAADSIALLLIECGAADAVLAQLTAGTQNSVPKIASSCASLLVEALKGFGPAVLPFDKLQKALPKILAHTNGAVRKEATDLAVELYRWMGVIFTNHLKPFPSNHLKKKNSKPSSLLPNKASRGQRNLSGALLEVRLLVGRRARRGRVRLRLQERRMVPSILWLSSSLLISPPSSPKAGATKLSTRRSGRTKRRG